VAARFSLIRLALFGSPVSRSLSPRIHGLFARQAGIDIEYRAIESTVQRLHVHLHELVAAGGRGCNVTVPLKRRACELVTRLSARARQAGAVNTVRFDGRDDWFGDNTDGCGLIRDILSNQGLTLEGRRLLIIGAGGAAAGILFDLLQQQPAQLVLANRTASRARDLAGRFAIVGPVQGAGFEDMERLAPFDLVINATSAGHAGDLPPLSGTLFAPGAACYDLNYGSAHTVLETWCASRAIACHNGLGMLVEQAAESFSLWTGHMPETAPVIEALASAG
jgi:shikimate dehydrogenase